MEVEKIEALSKQELPKEKTEALPKEEKTEETIEQVD